MSYGLRITNPSGELVLSSDAKGLYCIGKATLQGSVVQASGSFPSSYPGRQWGYSVYRISHAGPIIPAVELVLNKRVSILSVVESSSGVWDVTAYCGDTADADGFDTVQYAVDVWAYGLPLSAPSGYGMAIFNASGGCAYDLTRANPLFPRAYVVFPLDGTSMTLPSLAKPVAIGAPCGDRVLEERISANTWYTTTQRPAWLRTSSTVAGIVMVSKQKVRTFGPESPGFERDDRAETPSFLLDGSGLP